MLSFRIFIKIFIFQRLTFRVLCFKRVFMDNIQHCRQIYSIFTRPEDVKSCRSLSWLKQIHLRLMSVFIFVSMNVLYNLKQVSKETLSKGYT
jgi:hypothetical protein